MSCWPRACPTPRRRLVSPPSGRTTSPRRYWPRWPTVPRCSTAPIQCDLGFGGERLGYLLTLGDGAARVEKGWDSDAAATLLAPLIAWSQRGASEPGSRRRRRATAPRRAQRADAAPVTRLTSHCDVNSQEGLAGVNTYDYLRTQSRDTVTWSPAAKSLLVIVIE